MTSTQDPTSAIEAQAAALQEPITPFPQFQRLPFELQLVIMV